MGAMKQDKQSPISAEHLEDSDESLQLFRQAVQDARPLTKKHVSHPKPKPKPIPLQFIRDEQQALRDSLSDGYIPGHELESGEELLYLREGQSPLVMSKLRRGHWVIQASIDLHGLVSDEARLYVADFLNQCKKRGLRCVRIVHGKGLGSKNREPVLKHKLRNWLIQRDEVLAYAQAKPHDGGSGAVIVLIRA
jgi:DNA-nicking Smr family endonuclease